MPPRRCELLLLPSFRLDFAPRDVILSLFLSPSLCAESRPGCQGQQQAPRLYHGSMTPKSFLPV